MPSELSWNMAGNQITVEQETTYPEADTTNLTLRPERSATFNLSFRV